MRDFKCIKTILLSLALASSTTVFVSAATTSTTPTGSTGGFTAGGDNNAAFINAAAIGRNNRALTGGAIAMGTGNIASGVNSLALGSANQATGTSSIAILAQAQSSGDFSMALGFQAKSSGNGSTAIGISSNSEATRSFTVNGGHATATAVDGIAIGRNSLVSTPNGVAIGSGAVASRPAGVAGFDAGKDGNGGAAWVSTESAIAIGDEEKGITRQITGLAAGTMDTDAVNVAQYRSLANTVNRVGANAAALAALHPVDYDEDNKMSFAAGYGHFRNKNSLALGAFYRPNEKMIFSVGGVLGVDRMYNAGIGFRVGSGEYVSKATMKQEIESLKASNAMLVADNEKMHAELAEIKAMLQNK